MLEMRGEAAVDRADRPLVVRDDPRAFAGGNDRFDGDHEPFREPLAEAPVVVIRDARLFMDGSPHPVSAEIPHHGKAAAARLPLHGAADIEDAIPGRGRVRALPERAFGAADQLACGRRYGAGGHCHGGIGEVAVLLGDKIQLHQVALADDALAGDAVDRLFVDTNAQRAGKPIDFRRGGFGAVLSQHPRADLVQFRRRDAGADGGRGPVERRADNPADGAELRQFLLSADGHNPILSRSCARAPGMRLQSGFAMVIRDKSVLITGAGRGIGKRLAMGFAQAGARVGLLARSQAELDLAKLEIEQAGGNALRIRADVRDLEQMQAAADRMRAVFGGLDALVAAAGVQGPVGPFLSSKAKAWNETIETNLIGAVNACRAALPAMIDKRSGKLILIVGGGSGHSRPNFSAYAASKAAIVRFSECLADEVADHNVQVNCISPGEAYTHMTDEILHAGEDRAGRREIEDAEQVRVTGGVAPEKQIQLALFLASDRSNHITGKLIHVNDDWRRFEQENMKPELYTLRRVQKI